MNNEQMNKWLKFWVPEHGIYNNNLMPFGWHIQIYCSAMSLCLLHVNFSFSLYRCGAYPHCANQQVNIVVINKYRKQHGHRHYMCNALLY